jgi:pSer/pThr/pTyr-binding forkhead associated (FHA) protein
MSEHFFLINQNQVFYLEGDEIGRGMHNDLVIADLRVSRSHAKVRVMNGEVVIADLNSSGGTRVNNRPVVQKLLKPGDVIALGRVFTMTYWYDRDNLPFDTTPYEPPREPNNKSTETGQLPGLKKE